MAIVNLVIETITELSSTYIVSTLPKPIKKFLFNSQIKKLNKVIDKIPENRVTYETLTEFCRDAFTRYYSYTDKIAKFENIKINMGSYSEKPPFINNSNEYNIFITLSDESYARIILQPTNDYVNPRTFRSVITVRTQDNMDRPISFSSRSFDKYQEISEEVINMIADEDKLSDKSVEYYNLVLHELSDSIKKYLHTYIGVQDKINL